MPTQSFRAANAIPNPLVAEPIVTESGNGVRRVERRSVDRGVEFRLAESPAPDRAVRSTDNRLSRHVAEFAADVRASLTIAGQRELPSKYLYDELGSALFEAICVLPEYGVTRADARLLQRYANEIVNRLPSPIQVAELGSGSGKKTRWILEALAKRQRTYYYPDRKSVV